MLRGDLLRTEFQEGARVVGPTHSGGEMYFSAPVHKCIGSSVEEASLVGAALPQATSLVGSGVGMGTGPRSTVPPV